VRRDIFLTGQAVVLRALVTGMIRVLPYRLWRPLLQASLQVATALSQSDFGYSDRIISIIERTDRLAPLGRCLERSLTAWLLLRRHAPCRLRLAVAWKSRSDPFAHACLEVDGRIVLGQPMERMAFLDAQPVKGGAARSS